MSKRSLNRKGEVQKERRWEEIGEGETDGGRGAGRVVSAFGGTEGGVRQTVRAGKWCQAAIPRRTGPGQRVLAG